MNDNQIHTWWAKLWRDHSVTVHHKNLQVLVTEIFKVKNNLVPDIIKNVLGLKELS